MRKDVRTPGLFPGRANGNTTLRQEALAVFDGINSAGGI
jgi:hypothetical protein